MRDEKVKVLKAIRPLEAGNLVRGQFRGYQNEPGVAANSTTETFAAFKLELNSWRGVPFYFRAAKCLPATCTEIVVRLRELPPLYEGFGVKMNHCRLRISPDVGFAIGMNSINTEHEAVNQPVEIFWRPCPNAKEMDAYERVLGDAMAGDASLFVRGDYVEEAWRIVDPVLKSATPVFGYEPGTWGPPEAYGIMPPGGWQDPEASLTGLPPTTCGESKSPMAWLGAVSWGAKFW